MKAIRHIGIVVSDIEKSICFYRDLIGFQITRQMEESGDYIDNMLALRVVKVTTVKMKAPDGQMIELLKFHSHQREQKPRDIEDIGIAHIAIEVDDLNDEYNRLKDEGVLFNSPPQLSPDGYVKVIFCRAPEGTFIELVEVL
jgi:catechol 2,3-dioxygenase-like lactoylglutathione lyase family enzyme|tara:strand:+ start:169 stop:594 length:426 start_codon:yes stop_codon:yes gene_type:complete